MCEFTHLHNHSEYSLLDGLSSVNAYVEALKKVGQKSLALTDHGNMHGAVEFYRAMKSAEMHPVLGCEFYSTPFGVGYEDKTRSAGHMLVLAQTQNGYQNLLKLSKEAGELGFYYKPRITSESLAKYSDGLITTSGCMAAYIPQAIMNGNLQQADAIAKWYKDIFGDNFYIELQVHPGIPELNEINKHLLILARKYDVKPILTNDTHYANATDAPTHDVLLCVQTKSNIYKADRFKFTDNEYYLKTEAEMRKTFLPYMDASNIAEYMRTAHEIALSCEVNPAADVTPHIPSIKIDGLTDPLSFLQGLVSEKIAQVYPDYATNAEVQKRLEEEYDTIQKTNFANYYLIIWDICMQAKKLGISYNTRGSAAGSIVNYITGISFVDPIVNNLLYSRFLSIHRVSIPDVDLDFEDDRRQEMIDYIVAKYGDEFVCQVVTFGHMKARAAVRDVGRALAVDLPIVDEIAKSIKNTPGKPINLENSLDTESEYYSKEFAELASHDQNTIDILQYAKPLENTVRHTGIHAAALLIGDIPLVDRIPLMTSKSAKTKFVSQLDYPTSESMGMLKVDLLGLITLSIIRESCKLINKRHGTSYSYDNIPYDDPSSYDIIAKGNTVGIFQVENSGMTRYLTQMNPNRFGHIADMISLYRPGPIGYIPTYINRMKGIEPVILKHPLLEHIVMDTQGTLIYQEQINQVFMQLAGFHAGDADKVRKYISKKNVPEIHKHRPIFVAGCKNNGIEEAIAESIYDDINEFALYGFARSHAASYARLSLITAWLKSNYMTEFITACLICEGETTDKRVKYIEDATRNGIKVIPPQIGGSRWFSITPKGKIQFGLGAIDGIGSAMGDKIANATPDTIFSIGLKKNQLQRLVQAGCFDDLLTDRQQLLANIDDLSEYGKQVYRWKKIGQRLLYEPEFKVKTSNKVTSYSAAMDEYKALGAWLVFHPLRGISKRDKETVTRISELTEKCYIIGVVTNSEELTTKHGKRMLKFIMTDEYGSMEILVGTKECKGLTVKDGDILHMHVNVDMNEEDFRYTGFASNITKLENTK